MLSESRCYYFLQGPQSSTTLWYELRLRLMKHITFLRGGEKKEGGPLRQGSVNKEGASAILKARQLCLALILCLKA